MSDVWWGKESRTGGTRGRVEASGASRSRRGPNRRRPARRRARRSARAQIKSFHAGVDEPARRTMPAWRSRNFSASRWSRARTSEPTTRQAFVEFLNPGGGPAAARRRRPPRGSNSKSRRARRSRSSSAEGFKIGAQPAEGPDDLVIFETERDLLAAPDKIEEVHVQQDNLSSRWTSRPRRRQGKLPSFRQPAEAGRRSLHRPRGRSEAGADHRARHSRRRAARRSAARRRVGGVAPLPVAPAPHP